MKRLILGSLSALLGSAMVIPAVNAQEFTLRPFNLVHMAYQGYFRDQGIPSHGRFVAGVQLRHIEAEEIIQGAVDSNRLPASVLDDPSYEHAVDQQLRAFLNNRTTNF